MVNPATNEKLGSVPDCSIEDVNQAVESADKGFKIWSSFTAEVNADLSRRLLSEAEIHFAACFKQRSKVLKKMVDLHVEHRQHLAEIITHENVKLADGTQTPMERF